MKAWTALGTLGIVMTFSSTSWADNFVKLTEQQIELNNQAIEAQQEGDLLKAQKLIESMILLGETDVAWLQLGRIYEMQKKCIGAMDADHEKGVFDYVHPCPLSWSHWQAGGLWLVY